MIMTAHGAEMWSAGGLMIRIMRAFISLRRTKEAEREREREVRIVAILTL